MHGKSEKKLFKFSKTKDYKSTSKIIEFYTFCGNFCLKLYDTVCS